MKTFIRLILIIGFVCICKAQPKVYKIHYLESSLVEETTVLPNKFYEDTDVYLNGELLVHYEE